MKMKFRRFLACMLILMLMSADFGAIAESVIKTLTLPAGLKIIEEETFCGDTSIKKVIIPNGTIEIRSRAFADSSITEIELPDTLEYIADDTFEDCGDFTVIAEDDSYAYEWAVSKGYIKCLHAESTWEYIKTTYAQISGNVSQHQVTNHYMLTCDDCGEVTNTNYTENLQGDHTFDNTNKCTLCGYVKPQETEVVPLAPEWEWIDYHYCTIELEWNKVEGVDGYYVLRSLNEYDGFEVVAIVTSGDITSWIDTSSNGLQEDTRYYYKLKSYKGSLESLDSEVNSSWTGFEFVPITSVTLDKKTLIMKVGDKASLNETVLPTNASEEVDWISSDESIATVTSYGRVTAKALGTATITAIAEDGTGHFDTCVVKVISLATPEIDIDGYATTANSIFISWNKIENAEGYYLYRKDDRGDWDNEDYEIVATITSGDVLEYQDTGLYPDTYYSYYLRAYADGGNIVSSKSNTNADTTDREDIDVGIPKNVAVTAIGGNSIKITWDAVKGVDGYYICRSTTPTGAYKQLTPAVTGSSLMYIDADLEPNTTYYYRVRAFIRTALSGYSSWASATAVETVISSPPSPPTTPEPDVGPTATPDTIEELKWAVSYDKNYATITVNVVLGTPEAGTDYLFIAEDADGGHHFSTIGAGKTSASFRIEDLQMNFAEKYSLFVLPVGVTLTTTNRDEYFIEDIVLSFENVPLKWRAKMSGDSTITVTVQEGVPDTNTPYLFIAEDSDGLHYPGNSTPNIAAGATSATFKIKNLKMKRAKAYDLYVLPAGVSLTDDNRSQYRLEEKIVVPLWSGNMIYNVYSGDTDVTGTKKLHTDEDIKVVWEASYGVYNVEVSAKLNGQVVFTETYTDPKLIDGDDPVTTTIDSSKFGDAKVGDKLEISVTVTPTAEDQAVLSGANLAPTASKSWKEGMFIEQLTELDLALTNNSTDLDPVLAKASVDYAALAYSTSNTVAKQLKADGFTVRDYAGYNHPNSDHYVGYSIASKIVNRDGEDYAIYAVVIRGTFDSIEWLYNFNLGTGTTHLDFNACAINIKSSLNNLISEDGYENVHVWITGHSRGAAVGNILAAKCCNDSAISNVYAYTFATPAVSTNCDGSLPIYNYVDRADLIPMLPMEEWGYGRHGTTIYFGAIDAEMALIPFYVREAVNDDKILFAGVYEVLYDYVKEYLRTSPGMTLEDILLYLAVEVKLSGLYDAWCAWYYANGYSPSTVVTEVEELIVAISAAIDLATSKYDAIFEHHVQTNYVNIIYGMY